MVMFVERLIALMDSLTKENFTLNPAFYSSNPNRPSSPLSPTSSSPISPRSRSFSFSSKSTARVRTGSPFKVVMRLLLTCLDGYAGDEAQVLKLVGYLQAAFKVS